MTFKKVVSAKEIGKTAAAGQLGNNIPKIGRPGRQVTSHDHRRPKSVAFQGRTFTIKNCEKIKPIQCCLRPGVQEKYPRKGGVRWRSLASTKTREKLMFQASYGIREMHWTQLKAAEAFSALLERTPWNAMLRHLSECGFHARLGVKNIELA